MRESQRKRGAKVELVDEVLELYNQARAGEWTFLGLDAQQLTWIPRNLTHRSHAIARLICHILFFASTMCFWPCMNNFVC